MLLNDKVTWTSITTNVRENVMLRFLSDPRVRKFILYRLRRLALLKRVKMQNTLSGVQEYMSVQVRIVFS